MTVPSLILSAPGSGSGKTIAATGILRAFARRGVRVGAAKSGPDYIDGGFLAAAAGVGRSNLDVWSMRSGTLATEVSRHHGFDLLLIEGAVGLFDGIGFEGRGSTADLAAALGAPVVLVLDARGAATSLAATLLGFRQFRRDVTVSGVIASRVGGPAHADTIARACMAACPDVAFLGCLPRDDGLVLPSRHLGLVQATEQPDLEGLMERAADLSDQHLDLDHLLRLARPAVVGPLAERPPLPPLGQRIAVAFDDAFGFAYGHVLAGWQDAGAELLPFSPLAGEGPDLAADAVFLPGGYPELYAAHIAGAEAFLVGLGAAARLGRPIYGECGGFMVLGRALIDDRGYAHPMANLLPIVTSFQHRQRHLGYRRAQLLTDGPLGRRGLVYAGHEFHYSTLVEAGEAPGLFQVSDGQARSLGVAGAMVGSVFGSYLHLLDQQD
ncbi:MAG: cobyrinate a,c-diamide synthase [Alphaproteobacteria bacterium]|nr:cobyrinate a,c-diamide synthase [Alphaproteobacteria bacterium]TAD90080.1 MAG: cobyrinate a,c-diamide synthase [Alphaproteobacteria bacterium]